MLEVEAADVDEAAACLAAYGAVTPYLRYLREGPGAACLALEGNWLAVCAVVGQLATLLEDRRAVRRARLKAELEAGAFEFDAAGAGCTCLVLPNVRVVLGDETADETGCGPGCPGSANVCESWYSAPRR